MNGDQKAALDREVLAGYAHGPGAPVRATLRALRKTETAYAAILVEGISDQIAVETLARRMDRDLDGEGIAVVPVGGAQATARYLSELGPAGDGLVLVGLYDIDAAETIRRALGRSGIGQAETIEDLADHGFHACDRDLEDELIRAAGVALVEAVVESQGDHGALATFRRQPEWRDRRPEDQLRRFLGSKARRSLRYARLLIEAMEPNLAPPPLVSVLDRV